MELQTPRYFEKSAGILKRLLAFITDLFILNITVFSPLQKILAPLKMNIFSLPDSAVVSGILGIVSILALGYFAMMEYYYKKTIGMMLFKIEVAGNLSIWKAITRHIYLVPLFPFSLFLIIDPLYLLFKGERLSEKLTKTNTVEYIRMV